MGCSNDFRSEKVKMPAKKGIVTGITYGLFQLLFMNAMAADTRSPGQGSALDNLPRLEPALEQGTSVNVDIEKRAQDPALTRLLDRRITPSHFQIAGVNAIPFALVAAEFSGMTNREVTVADVLHAAERVTKMYRDRGYPLSFAFVPAQRFDNNVVVIDVVEGFVDKISIEGNPGASEHHLRKIAGQLKKVRPLSQAVFERVTGILSLQPGMRIDATVRPPTTTDGAAEMVLNIRRRAVTASVALDNAASNVRGIVSVTENGLTPLGEQVTVSTMVPRGPSHEEYVGLNYAQPIGIEGTIFQLNVSDYTAEPVNQDLLPLLFEPRYYTKTQRVGATLGHPLLLDNSSNLTLSGGAYAVRNAVRYTPSLSLGPAFSGDVVSESSIRALSLEMAWTNIAEQSVTQISGGVYHGVDVAGASLTNSDIDLGFTRFRTQFSRSDRFASQIGTTFSGTGQFSDSILPTSEQISFGARQFGLAYPVGEIAGDKGWGLALEVNYAIGADHAWIRQIQPYVMTDSARIYGNTGTPTHHKLASVGAGFRVSDQRRYSLDLSLARPTGDIPVNARDRSLRLNVSYSYQLD